LLTEEGRLREPGWSDSPILAYDREAIRSPAWRIKEWDYYCILSRDVGIALTVADNGYMGLLSATVFDFSVPAETSDSVMTLFPMGRWGLPSSSVSGLTEVEAGGASMSFSAADGSRKLKFSWPSFGAKGGPRAPVGLEGVLDLEEEPGRASMVIATPFKRPRRGFYYNQKINCQSVRGRFGFGSREIGLEKGEAFAVLDWGRGVWPWSNSWLWGSASGVARCVAIGDADCTKPDVAARGAISDANRGGNGFARCGASFGFNIGYGFGDTGAASENMVFYGGKAHKIGRLRIDLDERDFMRPWHAVSEDERLDMTLEPLLDRTSKTDLGLLASIQHQVFGSWKGYAILDDGSRVEVEDLRGFCEKVVNRW